jgi:hypothetical protein
MGSEMQPVVMRAQKRESQISHGNKNVVVSVKKITFRIIILGFEFAEKTRFICFAKI